jgi:hypothetical protein
MKIGNWIIRKHLQIQKEKQDRKLDEVRKGLRKTQSRSPQLRSMVQPEMERVRQLSRQLKKVRSREDLRRWRGLYEMCLPAFKAAINLTPQKIDKSKRRPQKRRKR